MIRVMTKGEFFTSLTAGSHYRMQLAYTIQDTPIDASND